MPCFASRSSAGPDTGLSCHSFEFNGSRVKLEVTKDPETRFRLSGNNGGLDIFDGEQVFLSGVSTLPTLAHAPNQAFINLSSRCIYGCMFCAAPFMVKDIIGEMGPERALRIVNISANHPGFEAVALTSGVPDSSSKTNKRMAEVVKAVRTQYPELPIGVEAYFEDLDDIRMLKDAGADEIKINVEAWSEDIFARVCPKRENDIILAGLEKAVDIFGKGKVTSNIIIGLGETDNNVEEGVAALAGMGVTANLRGIRVNEMNKQPLKEALGAVPERVTAERLIGLGNMHKRVLEEHELTTLSFRTMCFSCQCCDIVPMRDL